MVQANEDLTNKVMMTTSVIQYVIVLIVLTLVVVLLKKGYHENKRTPLLTNINAALASCRYVVTLDTTFDPLLLVQNPPLQRLEVDQSVQMQLQLVHVRNNNWRTCPTRT